MHRFAAIVLSSFISTGLAALESHHEEMTAAAKERDCDRVYEIGMPHAERGDTTAQLIMGRCNLGVGDSGEGHYWLERALDGGEGRAAAYLAIYHSSLAAGEDHGEMIKACRYSKRGAALGDVLSKNYLMTFKCDEVLGQQARAEVEEGATAQAESEATAEEREESKPVQEVIFTYLGKPITFNERVEAFCRDEQSGGIAECHFRREGDGRYVIDQLPPGRYALRVAVDENRANPPEGPGDYFRYNQFRVNSDLNGPLRVAMQKLIHVIKPFNNNRAVEGNSGDCEQKQHFDIAADGKAAIAFAWQMLEPDVTYHYTLWKANCGGGGMERLSYKQTTEMQVTEALPPSREGEFYLFRITAVKNGEMIGNLFLRDSGGSGMPQYRFRVSDKVSAVVINSTRAEADKLLSAAKEFATNDIVTLAGVIVLVGVVMLVLLTRRGPVIEEKAVTKDRGGEGLAIMILLFAIALSVGGYYLSTDFGDPVDALLSKSVEQVTRPEPSQPFRVEEDKDRSAREERQAHMRAEFELVVPLPKWWSEIKEPEYVFNSHSDVVAVLPHINYSEEGVADRRKVIKQCYLGIIANAADDDLVTTCLKVIAMLEKDDALILKVSDFAHRFYFNYQHGTEYCSSCRPADTMASIVRSASSALLRQGNPDAAAEMLKRFIEQRASDTSDSDMERLYTRLADVYWKQGMREESVNLLQTTYDNYRDRVNYPASLHYLEEYKKQMRAAGG